MVFKTIHFYCDEQKEDNGVLIKTHDERGDHKIHAMLLLECLDDLWFCTLCIILELFLNLICELAAICF